MTQPARLLDDRTPSIRAAGRPTTVVLTVTLAACTGERWQTIGVGASQEEALTWALESAPAGVAWLVSAWSDTYGD